jgi:hypothetical protein
MAGVFVEVGLVGLRSCFPKAISTRRCEAADSQTVTFRIKWHNFFGIIWRITRPTMGLYPGEPKRGATNVRQISPKEVGQIIPKVSPGYRNILTQNPLSYAILCVITSFITLL